MAFVSVPNLHTIATRATSGKPSSNSGSLSPPSISYSAPVIVHGKFHISLLNLLLFAAINLTKFLLLNEAGCSCYITGRLVKVSRLV